MPLPKRYLYDAQSYHKPDAFQELSVDSVLDDANMSRTLGVINQLSYLSNSALEMFHGLAMLTEDLSERIHIASVRTVALSERIPSIERRVNSADDDSQDSTLRIPGIPRYLQSREMTTPSLFVKSTNYPSIQQLYKVCHPPPQLWRIEMFTSEDCFRNFSFPGLFFQEWLRGEILKQEENKQQRKRNKAIKKQQKLERRRLREEQLATGGFIGEEEDLDGLENDDDIDGRKRASKRRQTLSEAAAARRKSSRGRLLNAEQQRERQELINTANASIQNAGQDVEFDGGGPEDSNFVTGTDAEHNVGFAAADVVDEEKEELKASELPEDKPKVRGISKLFSFKVKKGKDKDVDKPTEGDERENVLHGDVHRTSTTDRNSQLVAKDDEDVTQAAKLAKGNSKKVTGADASDSLAAGKRGSVVVDDLSLQILTNKNTAGQAGPTNASSSLRTSSAAIFSTIGVDNTGPAAAHNSGLADSFAAGTGTDDTDKSQASSVQGETAGMFDLKHLSLAMSSTRRRKQRPKQQQQQQQQPQQPQQQQQQPSSSLKVSKQHAYSSSNRDAAGPSMRIGDKIINAKTAQGAPRLKLKNTDHQAALSSVPFSNAENSGQLNAESVAALGAAVSTEGGSLVPRRKSLLAKSTAVDAANAVAIAGSGGSGGSTAVEMDADVNHGDVKHESTQKKPYMKRASLILSAPPTINYDPSSDPTAMQATEQSGGMDLLGLEGSEDVLLSPSTRRLSLVQQLQNDVLEAEEIKHHLLLPKRDAEAGTAAAHSQRYSASSITKSRHSSKSGTMESKGERESMGAGADADYNVAGDEREQWTTAAADQQEHNQAHHNRESLSRESFNASVAQQSIAEKSQGEEWENWLPEEAADDALLSGTQQESSYADNQLNYADYIGEDDGSTLTDAKSSTGRSSTVARPPPPPPPPRSRTSVDFNGYTGSEAHDPDIDDFFDNSVATDDDAAAAAAHDDSTSKSTPSPPPPPPPPPKPKSALTNDVLGGIRTGAVQLRKAAPIEKKPDNRMQLMLSIKKGTSMLKDVTATARPVSTKVPEVKQNEAVAAILANRALIAGSDSDSSDSDSDSEYTDDGYG